MISFPGYDTIIQKVYDEKQEHVFEFWNDINENEKRSLLDHLSDVNFDEFNKQYEMTKNDETVLQNYSPADYIRIPKTDSDRKKFSDAKLKGEELIKAGKVCAFLVAGGQGSRLGYDGPKGAYNITPVKNKSLFQVHTEKIMKSSSKYDVEIPFLIMTSQMNYEQTLQHFEENNYFGIDKSQVFMFKQSMIPSMTNDGKLILADNHTLFKNPDGHGGSLTALKKSGMLDMMKDRGIDYISYFQVDNPTVHVIDPVFLGFHVIESADISSKALSKAYPQEKVGNFVTFADGTTGVVEYSDLPEEKAYEKNPNGSLRYSAGSIAIHIFSRSFIESITESGEVNLPYHIAKKKIKSFSKDGINEIQGYKFEKFVFDSLPLTKNNTILETLRKDEFAPVKNKTGLDSVDSSRQLMMDLHREWLESRNIQIPDGVAIIEISPLAAVEPGDIDPNIEIPNEPEVYIE
jgi:UDP-N-acetylglucosamine/UDP-N-acetylgalactosamine diphosphorylase